MDASARPPGDLEYPKVIQFRSGGGMGWKLVLGVVLLGFIGVPLSISGAFGSGLTAWFWALFLAFFAVGGFVFGIVGIRVTLTLDRDSFTYRGGLSRVSYRWDEVESFYPANLSDAAGAGFVFSGADLSLPGAGYVLTESGLARRNRFVRMLGSSGLRIIQARDIPAEELADLLNRYREAVPHEPQSDVPVRDSEVVHLSRPIVARVLIAANAVAFAWEVAHERTLLPARDTSAPPGALVPTDVGNGDWWLTITSGFLHADPMHLLANMVGLWLVGLLLERLIGSGRFLALYGISLVAGSAGAMLLTPDAATLGASGAVFGVLAAGVVADARGDGSATEGMALLFLIVSVLLTFMQPGLSVGGHLGGALAGALVMLVLTQRSARSRLVLRPASQAVPGVLAIGLAVVVATWLAADRSL